ncbi:MAG: AsmA family protein [Acetobacteraceae bacterium]
MTTNHSRRRRWLLGLGLPILLVGVIVGAAWFWISHHLVGLVEGRASAMIGRPVSIGDVHISPGRITTISAENVVVDNPKDWPADSAKLAVVPRLVVTFDLWRYVTRREIDLPSIDIQQPRLLIGELANHETNYHLSLSGGGGSGARIGELRIEGGHIHTVLDPLRANFDVAVQTQEPAGGTPTLLAEARGAYAGQPIQARLEGGAILALRDAAQPWPIDLRLVNGQTQVRLRGTIADPMALAGADLRLTLAGASLSGLDKLTGIALPETPPFQLAGKLDFADRKVRLQEIAGRVGTSDLEGTLAIDPGTERPVLFADLASRSVNLVDLGGFIGAKPGPETPKESAAPGLLPNTPISVPKFQYADVHLRYRAARIQGRSMPLDNLVAALDIVAGQVVVHPISFGVGQGRIRVNARLDPAGRAVRANAEIDFQSLDLARLMAATHTFGGAGALSGSARIAGTGTSLAAIAANGDGEILVGMAGGDLSALLVDLSGLELGNAVLSALGLPRRTAIECMVAYFALERGVLRSRAFVLDTNEAIVGGTGTIDMRNDALALQIRTAPKHFSIGSLPGPLNISGTLKHPRILPSAQTVARVGIAGALAALLPPLAVLPTIQFGTADHHRCDALLLQARQVAPGTPPPAPRGAVRSR